ncbi:hypothetical protein [Rubripirellula amarantea]|nr:hypothetical protein [Rubripirellula amarantea]
MSSSSDVRAFKLAAAVDLAEEAELPLRLDCRSSADLTCFDFEGADLAVGDDAALVVTDLEDTALEVVLDAVALVVEVLDAAVLVVLLDLRLAFR